MRALPDVYDVEVVAGSGGDGTRRPELLIELPHGATRRRHFEATRRRLVGEFPEDLEQFFFVNTDVGCIEVARQVARMVTSPSGDPEVDRLTDGAGAGRAVGSVLILRGLVARTFIDCNRVVTGGASGRLQKGLTPGLPAYVGRTEDAETLKAMHAAYQAAAAEAYAAVCGAGGTALILHTYAPRSIRIDSVDEGIVAALRRAYEPETYEGWDLRPEVDLISETEDGTRLAPSALVGALRDRYSRIGVEVAENATYRLHEATMGHVHSTAWPGQVLCMEIRRDLLADPFEPFAEMRISERKARRMAAPIASALLGAASG